MFATSREGIQLRYGAHVGRLIQPHVGKIILSEGSTVCGDNGRQRVADGQLVGGWIAENQVVELFSGNVMLNSRPSDGSGYRKVAVSTHRGETYPTPKGGDSQQA